MPANRGMSPNWCPQADFQPRVALTAAEAASYKAQTVQELAAYMCSLGLSEIDSYGDRAMDIALDVAQQLHNPAREASDIAQEYLDEQLQPPKAEAEAFKPLRTMYVVLATQVDGSQSTTVSPAQRSTLSA